MPRRFHGATGGAKASGAICGTYAPIASERARPIGAGRFAGVNAHKPKARDGASSVQAWPDVFDNKVPTAWRVDLWALIRSTPELVWFLLTKRPQNNSRDAANRLGRGLAERLAWHHDEEPGGSAPLRPIPCRGTGCGQVSQRRAYVGAGRCHAVAGAVLRRQEGTNFLDHRWGRIRRWRSPDTSGLDPRPPRPGAWRRRPALCKTDRQQSYLFGPVSPARAKTRHNGRPICGCRTSCNEVLLLIAGPRTTSMTYWEEER